MTDIQRDRLHWEDRYHAGPTPWDTRITPPEVVAFWASGRLPHHGMALDLGCGTATNLAYLASLGLTAVGVELAGNALTRGRERLAQEQPALLSRIHLVQGDVAHVPFYALNARYILDIGCFHALSFADRPDYVQGVVNNLAPGGYYHLFAFDLLPEADRDPTKPPRGVAENEIVERFAPSLPVVEITRARPDRQPCRWYLLQKK